MAQSPQPPGNRTPESLVNRTPTLALPSTAGGKTPLPAAFAITPEDLFRLVEHYCVTLAESHYEPFFDLILDLLARQMPDATRPQALSFARQMLVNEAFHMLDRQDKQQEEIKNWLLELPEVISHTLAADVTRNAAEVWNVLFPRLQAELQVQAAPQIQMLKRLTGDQDFPWLSLPPGRERLQFALDVCRDRAGARFPHQRPEQFRWLMAWIEELLWAWGIAEGAIGGDRDLFQAPQHHLLVRVLRAVYQPKCPTPCLPISDAERREIFLPLYEEAQGSQGTLDTLLRTRFDAVPILPEVGAAFSPERHEAPKTFRRPAQSDRESLNSIYEVREAGLERRGQVVVKATVAIIDSTFAGSQVPPVAGVHPSALAAPTAAPALQADVLSGPDPFPRTRQASETDAASKTDAVPDTEEVQPPPAFQPRNGDVLAITGNTEPSSSDDSDLIMGH